MKGNQAEKGEDFAVLKQALQELIKGKNEVPELNKDLDNNIFDKIFSNIKDKKSCQWIMETLKGKDVNISNSCHETLLGVATMYGNFEVAKFLLEEKADPNKPAEVSGDIPIMSACAHLNYELVNLLIEHKSDVNFKGDFNSTPLGRAFLFYNQLQVSEWEWNAITRTELEFKKVIKLLLGNGAKIENVKYDFCIQSLFDENLKTAILSGELYGYLALSEVQL